MNIQDQLPISEIFHSVQGEGIFSGQPSIFVRVEGCNLKCVTCDTKRASRIGATHYVNTDDVVNKIRHYACNNIVYTGGEPLIYEEVLSRMILNRLADYRTTIETNCTIFPTHPFIGNVKLWSVSPKLPGMGATYDKKVLGKFIAFGKHYQLVQLKFVVETLEDLEQVKYIIRTYKPTKIPIILQPNNFKLKGHNNYFKVYKNLIEWSKDSAFAFYDIRVLPQLHILAWGRKEGV